jgi:hypothetical protein
MHFDIVQSSMLLRRHDNRLAANKHSNTAPDVTAVTVMFTKLPIAVESIGVELPAARNELALRARVFPDRFFFAMIILGAGQAAFAT